MVLWARLVKIANISLEERRFPMTRFPSKVKFIHSLIQLAISEHFPGTKHRTGSTQSIFLKVYYKVYSSSTVGPKLCMHKNHLGSLLKMHTSWVSHRNPDSWEWG